MFDFVKTDGSDALAELDTADYDFTNDRVYHANESTMKQNHSRRTQRYLNMSLLAIVMCSCIEKTEVEQIGTMRDSSMSCRQTATLFSRGFDHGPNSNSDLYPSWCGVMQFDQHIYCFEAGYHDVVRRMFDEGKIVAVPEGHQDLPCWGTMLDAMGKSAVRAEPRPRL